MRFLGGFVGTATISRNGLYSSQGNLSDAATEGTDAQQVY